MYFENISGLCLHFFFYYQLIGEFAKKEKIAFDGAFKAEILLGRDTRPSGESLLEAAKQVNLRT